MKPSPLKALLLAGTVIVTGGVSSSSAQSLIEWNVAGYTSSNSTPPPTVAEYAIVGSNVIAGELNLNAGASVTNGADSPDNFFVDNFSTSPTLNIIQLNSTPYVSFTLAPEAGFEISISNITFSSQRVLPDEFGIPSGPKNAVWGYRINEGNGYTAWTLSNEFTLTDTFSVTYTASTMPVWNLGTLTTTGTVEFGFWAYGGSVFSEDFSDAVFIGNIDGGFSPGLLVNGSVNAVPEPSITALLVGAGAIGFIFMRRRVAAKA